MPLGPILIAIAVFALIFFWVIPRINELFLISVRGGKLLVVRGNVPVAVKRDFADVIKRAGIEQATIRAIKTDSQARLVMGGVDEKTAQQLRNLFGIYPVSKLRTARPSIEQRNFGQRLGLVWLSWMLTSKRR